jgi:hypothetical protein
MRIRLVCAALALLLATSSARAQAVDGGRPRVLLETDAGGDPDDEQSMVRFLLYVNEWDVEGIICNRPRARDKENLNAQRTGLGIVQRLVHAYGECHANLVRHDPRYPQPKHVLERTIAGYDERDDGVKLIIDAVDRDDPRPLWYVEWGTDKGAATVNMKRALDKVRAERGAEGYSRFKQRLRIVSPDQYGPHTAEAPPFKLWVNTFQPPLEGKRWYHRFSALTARAGGFDLKRDLRTGHGPLGALYPTNTGLSPQKEGDTMTFLYLVPTGMNDPEQPTWGSWAGRYGLNPEFGGRRYYWANQADTWQGTTHRDNTLGRWAADLQNDFRARLDWCVQPPAAANHPPLVVVNGSAGRDILHLNAPPGEVKLSAAGSSDPDGQKLAYTWFVYGEAGTYRGDVALAGADAVEARILIPAAAAGKTIHVVLAVRDGGDPPLTRYRRVVIACKD